MKRAAIIMLGFFSSVCMLNSYVVYAGTTQNIKQEMQTFAIKTSASRIIYNPVANNAELTVINPQGYPMLVQSTVLDSDKKTPAPFIVTPPLFRLDGHKQNVIHLVSTSNVSKPNQESLYWLCLLAIPPNANSNWTKKSPKEATLLTQMRVNTCLKVIVRPPSLKSTPTEAAQKLTWLEKGNVLTVNNPTPFYINFSSIDIGKTEVTVPSYVAPFSTKDIKLKSHLEGTVSWTIITDYGAKSHVYQANLTNNS